jgi:[ribosomal protein S18]-alanine N-acetyltransferase
MVTQVNSSVRVATANDRQQIANLIHFETYVHRHLDWRAPLDWLAYQPYYVIEENGRIVATLACPPDPPDVAWLRVFAVSSGAALRMAWQSLWPAVHAALEENPKVSHIAGIPMLNWMRELLELSGFENTHHVVMLDWKAQPLPDAQVLPADIILRPMNFDDLKAVERVDQAAFKPLWRNSCDALEIAFQQAIMATVLETEDGLIGYQISTGMGMGRHVARLAVASAYQGRGLGYVLLRDVLSHFINRGVNHVTVNTQNDNLASLALYQKAGFEPTGEVFPVYELPSK